MESEKRKYIKRKVSLKVYLAEMDMTLKDFNDILGECTYNYMVAIATGRVHPGDELRKKIIELTEDRVSLPTFAQRKVWVRTDPKRKKRRTKDELQQQHIA